MSVVPDEYSGELHPHKPDSTQAVRYFLNAYCCVQTLLCTGQDLPLMSFNRKCYTGRMTCGRYRADPSLHPNAAQPPDIYMASMELDWT